MNEQEGISTHAALTVGTIVAVVVAIYAGGWQADLLAQHRGHGFAPGEWSVCGNGKCEQGEDQVLCPACAIGPDGVPLGNCECRMACEADCGNDGGDHGGHGGTECPDIECGRPPQHCEYKDSAFNSAGCLVNCDEYECNEPCPPPPPCPAPQRGCRYVDPIYDGECLLSCGRMHCSAVCGNNKCEDGERGECYEDCPCATVDCPAPPEHCKYVDIKYEGRCQLNCGELACDEPPPPPPDLQDRCETMDCEFGCRDGKCLPDPNRCAPYECIGPDGTQPPRCTADGHPINYLVDPCKAKPSAGIRCGGRYEPGEWFPAKDGCNRCLCQKDGTTSCTEMGCASDDDDGMIYCEGQYRPGETYPSPDGCNTCICGADGQSGCTRRACVDIPPPLPPEYECKEDNHCEPGEYCRDGWCKRDDHGGPDGKCTSSNQCHAGHVCSTEFGDCMSYCDGEGPCPDVCAGFCMPKALGHPQYLKGCSSNNDCPDHEQCTAEFTDDCLDECPLSDDICWEICDGKCIPRDFDDHPIEHDVIELDECNQIIMCAGPQGMYEVRGCDAAGNPIPDPCGGGDDHHYHDHHEDHDTEYEDEVITVPVEPTVSRFDDVDTVTLEGQAANKLANMKIIGGFPDGTFRPQNAVNRAEAAKFLMVSRYGGVEDHRNNGRFADLKEGEWYVKYVIAAAKAGVINGNPDGTFRPANTVNTAEFLKMLSEAFDLPTGGKHGFTDVPSDAWFEKYAGVAYAYDLFPGRADQGLLKPDRLLSRGDVAIAIFRLLEQI